MRAFGPVLLSALALTACTGILGSFDVSDTSDGGGGQPGVDGSLPGQEGGPGTDSGPQCTTAKCVDPSTLLDCAGKTQTCAFSCTETGGAHCGVIVPTPPVATGDLTTAGVGDITIAADTQFNTETGAIENVRPANGDPGKPEVTSNIGFRLADGADGAKIAVWSFKSLTIPTGVTVRFDSAHAAAFVAATQVSIVGVIDARGYEATTLCAPDGVAGPGGGVGADTATLGVGGGPGGGKSSPVGGIGAGGAAGGSYSRTGGKGGAGTGGNVGAVESATYGTPDLNPLLGGSGGGASSGARGGGGGGAIQIVAGTKVTIGGGGAPGGINAGGCNGHGAAFGNTGSAGGSGGAVLIESPALEMLVNGVIAANGGGGGAGNGAADPKAGQLAATYEPGATGVSGYGSGGAGGYGPTPAGVSGASGTSNGGGSGGGSAGRIRINNRSASFTVPTGAIVSPNFGITPNPPTSAGPLVVQ